MDENILPRVPGQNIAQALQTLPDASTVIDTHICAHEALCPPCLTARGNPDYRLPLHLVHQSGLKMNSRAIPIVTSMMRAFGYAPMHASSSALSFSLTSGPR